jgi:hypothetical protein
MTSIKRLALLVLSDVSLFLGGLVCLGASAGLFMGPPLGVRVRSRMRARRKRRLHIFTDYYAPDESRAFKLVSILFGACGGLW